MNSKLKTILTICGWIFAYFLFLVLGAFIYVVLEQKNDLERKQFAHDNFLEILQKYNYSVNDPIIKEIIIAAINASDIDAIDITDFEAEPASVWNLASAVFFASAIVTTIGYGNIAPVTSGGRAFTIFYALLGIPFTGFVLAKIGVGLSNVIKKADDFIGDRIKQCFPRVSDQDTMKKHIRIVQIVFVVVIYVTFLWIVPAALMTVTDKMSMNDAVYFCFISITTIGLGDIVPGVSDKGVSHEFTSESLHASAMQVLTIVYFLLGLSGLTIMLSLIGSLAHTLAKATKDRIVDAAGLTAGNGAVRKIGQVGTDFKNSSQRIAQSVRRSVVKRDSSQTWEGKKPFQGPDDSIDEGCEVMYDPSSRKYEDNDNEKGSGFNIRLISEKQPQVEIDLAETLDSGSTTSLHQNHSDNQQNQYHLPVPDM